MQAIAVKASNHAETITAVALAAGLSLARVITREPMNEHFKSFAYLPQRWQEWVDADYGKSVRRIRRPAEHDRLLKYLDHATSFSVGGATAYAFAPMLQMDYPSALRKLQVTGLQLQGDNQESQAFSLGSNAVPAFAINADITMTTGKTAAQLAHGVMLWVLKAQLKHWDELLRWTQNPGLAVSYESFPSGLGDPKSTVVDNGHTELDPQTPTVRLLD